MWMLASLVSTRTLAPRSKWKVFVHSSDEADGRTERKSMQIIRIIESPLRIRNRSYRAYWTYMTYWLFDYSTQNPASLVVRLDRASRIHQSVSYCVVF